MNESQPNARGDAPEYRAGTPPLQPWDEHNRRLQAQVRPEGWVNPEPGGRYR